MHGFFIFRLADANGDVDLARALHDHPHVDAGASERTEQTAGDARPSRHVPSDDGHHGKPVCNADAVRADGGGNVRQKRLAAGGDRRGRGDERDAAKPRRDVVKRDFVRFEHRENPAAVAHGAVHIFLLHLYGAIALAPCDSRDGTDGRRALRGDEGAGGVRLHRGADVNGNAHTPGWRHRVLVQHVGAHIRKLPYLVIGHGRNRPCAGHDCGIGAEDAGLCSEIKELVNVETEKQEDEGSEGIILLSDNLQRLQSEITEMKTELSYDKERRERLRTAINLRLKELRYIQF